MDFVLFAILWLQPVGVPAPDEDVQAFHACIANAEPSYDFGHCVDLVFVPCANIRENWSRVATMTCAEEERLLWREYYDQAYAELVAHMQTSEETERIARLEAAEASWWTHVEAQCSFRALRYRGGTLESIEPINCAAELTAERTMRLREERMGVFLNRPEEADEEPVVCKCPRLETASENVSNDGR